MGVPPFKETPMYIYIYIYLPWKLSIRAPWKRNMIFQTIIFSGSVLVFFWVHRMTNYPATLRDYDKTTIRTPMNQSI